MLADGSMESAIPVTTGRNVTVQVIQSSAVEMVLRTGSVNRIAPANTSETIVTGMALSIEPSASILARDRVLYDGPLAVHLLSLELLLIWFPFGKLMHAFFFVFSRGATGMRFSHRGVKV